MGSNVVYLDSTLRDGAQAEGISFSVQDKLNITKALDQLGMHFIEAGNPFSNPKDAEFFAKLKELKFENSKIVAFGSTRRKGMAVEEDLNIKALLDSGTEYVSIFGKSWDLHIDKILKVTREENLNMIKDTISYLTKNGKKVIYDAEHFFDGYKSDKSFALETIKTAKEAGAYNITLCDTNGGCLPFELIDIVKDVRKQIKGSLGVHLHNDTGLAVAESIMSVECGCDFVQGTLLGFGERSGNANLSTIIANLELKQQYTGIGKEKLTLLTRTCKQVAEISNIRLAQNMPYVGQSAFAHKAGMHIDGVNKLSKSFEHVDPSLIGNERKFLTSEVAGRSSIVKRIQKLYPVIEKEDPRTEKVVKRIKEMEKNGYQYEAAEASLDLLIMKELGLYKPFFDIKIFRTMTEQEFRTGFEPTPASAVVKVEVNGEEEISVAEGKGPVNAFDKALRKALEKFYPSLIQFQLTDFKVRILDSKRASSAVTRVIIESRDSSNIITTVGVSEDIIEASLLALVDALEYKLLLDSKA